jgi:hypothetical protein
MCRTEKIELKAEVEERGKKRRIYQDLRAGCGMTQEGIYVNSVRRNGAAMQNDAVVVDNEELLPRNLGS